MHSEALLLGTLSPAVLHYIKELEANLQNMQHDYLILKEKYDLLVYKRFVRSSEQFVDDTQQFLFTEEAPETKPAAPKEEAFTEVTSHTRKKAGRKAIDPNIPREEKIIDIPEADKICACGAALARIGEETNEKLHIIAPRIFVEKTIRPKYACRNCEGAEDEDHPTVRIAPVEPSIIPQGIASPSLLSTIIIQKYEDHIPFYRQEQQFERISVTVSRQNMANWQQQAFNALKPLFALLQQVLKSGQVIQMDETTVQVMGENGRSDTQKSYMWLARGGPPGKTVVLFEYRTTRGAEHAQKMLAGYNGYLQTDGYAGYDKAVDDVPGIVHAGCFAHARRKFFEASKVSEQAATAKEGMQHIKKLYIIETELRKRYEQNTGGETEKDAKRKLFTRVRQLRAWRPLKEFKEWLFKQREAVPPSLLLGKAIGYSLAQWDKLVRYLESPYLTPDNNACENAIRPFVLGRKNWMFNKSPAGAESSCGMYSLIQTAKQNGIVPSQYLTALFEKAPHASSHEDWEKLLPWNIFTS
jgi:transposase